jgi:hypothetical protein
VRHRTLDHVANPGFRKPFMAVVKRSTASGGPAHPRRCESETVHVLNHL